MLYSISVLICLSKRGHTNTHTLTHARKTRLSLSIHAPQNMCGTIAAFVVGDDDIRSCHDGDNDNDATMTIYV